MQRIGIDCTAEEFFPLNPSLAKDLEEARNKAKILGVEKYGENDTSVKDYIYKYHRAIYFRERKHKANRPPYSGFETIVDISTGVVRNLLDPCYWMYDNVMNDNKATITSISPQIQTKIIIERSQRLWDTLKNGLDKVVNNCSADDAKHILNLFENLMAFFGQRLKMDISEPRAIVFSISQIDSYPDRYNSIIKLLNIARRAQYLYTRMGNSKEKSRQETYFVPNRLLFPLLGLDPHGQYSRTSIKVVDLYNAAFYNKSIPLDTSIQNNEGKQLSLNYEE